MPQILSGKEVQRHHSLRVVVPGPSILEAFQKKGGMPFEEALQKGRLPSVKRIIEVVEAEGEETIHLGIPCWTGTIVAYAPPGQPLGAVIQHLNERIRWSMEIPAEYRDKRDVALITELPDYTIFCSDNQRIVQSALFMVHPIPDRSNFFRFEQGMPCGPALGGDSPDAMWFSRGGSYVGPAAIGFARKDTLAKTENDPSSEPAGSACLAKPARRPESITKTYYLCIIVRGAGAGGLGVIVENEAADPGTRQTDPAP
jgi:hypothetical protein